MLFVYRKGRRWETLDRFPDVTYADSHGLLAYGGAYDADCFEAGYRQGIFPWPCSHGVFDPIPWFCPRERFVLFPSELHVSHSLRRTVRHHRFEIKADRDFEAVIHHCATVSRAEGGTWITRGMERTFCELHDRGFAHSVESYLDGRLVGGFYGTCVGGVFGGESMFTLEPDASKVAFVVFVRRAARHGIRLIDCQCYTDNMARYGARHISREEFLEALSNGAGVPGGFWDGEWGVDA